MFSSSWRVITFESAGYSFNQYAYVYMARSFTAVGMDFRSLCLQCGRVGNSHSLDIGCYFDSRPPCPR